MVKKEYPAVNIRISDEQNERIEQLFKKKLEDPANRYLRFPDFLREVLSLEDKGLITFDDRLRLQGKDPSKIRRKSSVKIKDHPIKVITDSLAEVVIELGDEDNCFGAILDALLKDAQKRLEQRRKAKVSSSETED